MCLNTWHYSKLTCLFYNQNLADVVIFASHLDAPGVLLTIHYTRTSSKYSKSLYMITRLMIYLVEWKARAQYIKRMRRKSVKSVCWRCQMLRNACRKLLVCFMGGLWEHLWKAPVHHWERPEFVNLIHLDHFNLSCTPFAEAHWIWPKWCSFWLVMILV